MSKQRQKGTQYENHVRDTYLRPIWPLADRAPLRGVHDRGDFDGTPLVVEAKKWDAWRIGEWIRVVRRKANGADVPWVVVFAGDKRLADLSDDFVVSTAEHYFELQARLRCWEDRDE